MTNSTNIAPELDLNSPIEPIAGFALNGIDNGDASGISVSNAGDINGDGFDDVVVGAHRADPNGVYNGGESYVVFGGDNTFSSSIELSDLDGTNGFVIEGISRNFELGNSVSTAGDINADGIDDIILTGSPGGGGGDKAYVVFGRTDAFSDRLSVSSLDGVNGFSLNGISLSTSDAGDVNDDGVDDVIILGGGKAYVVFGNGSGFPSSVDLSSLNGIIGFGGFTINGVNSFTSGAGDINNDGIDDIIVVDTSADPGGRINAGESYVIFGDSGGFTSGSFEISDLDGNNGFTINGIDPLDGVGSSVSNAGDINGDGIADIIISSLSADPNGVNNAGESYVIFGRSDGFTGSIELSELNGSDGFVINGIGTNDLAGQAISAAGDVNNDGIDDLIIGAPSANASSFNGGEGYVVFGQSSGFSSSLDLSNLDGSNGFVIDASAIYAGSTAGSGRLGASVSTAGDINSDGISDLIIGATGGNPNPSGVTGASFVVLGRTGLGSNGIVDLDDILGADLTPFSGVDFSASFGGNPTTIVAENLGVRDLDSSNLVQATVTLMNRPDGADESLLVDVSGTGLAANYDSATGVLTLTGNVATSTYERVLRTVQYQNVSAAPDTIDRIIEFILDDGNALNSTSIAAISTITFNGATNGDDTFFGTPNDDTFSGLGGNDTIIGANGNDTLNGDAGNDQLEGRNGDDMLNGGPGNDTLLGLANSDILNGDAADDTLNGGNGDDVLNGGDGNDTLNGGGGNDTLNGNADDDLLIGDSGNDFLFGNDGNDILEGRNGNDELDGGAGDDSLFGLRDNDLLNGGLGADLLDGGANNDTLNGGEGDDTLSGSTGDDVLNGEGGADSLNGGNGIDILNGGSGNDTLNGANGDDSLFGLDGDDLLEGRNGNDTLNGEDGDDTLFGLKDIDTLNGGDGMDSLDGGAGNDFLFGDGDNDTLNGGTGNDELNGGTGDDTLIGDDGDDVLNGEAGADLLEGRNGNDTLDGGDGDDTLKGFANDDVLTGSLGNDTLDGGSGNDVLVGGVLGTSGTTAQIDTLIGSSGLDTYRVEVMYRSFGDSDYALIQGFNRNDDVIELGAGTYTLANTIGGLPTGTGVYNSGELVAVVAGYNENQLNLNASYFVIG